MNGTGSLRGTWGVGQALAGHGKTGWTGRDPWVTGRAGRTLLFAGLFVAGTLDQIGDQRDGACCEQYGAHAMVADESAGLA